MRARLAFNRYGVEHMGPRIPSRAAWFAGKTVVDHQSNADQEEWKSWNSDQRLQWKKDRKSLYQSQIEEAKAKAGDRYKHFWS